MSAHHPTMLVAAILFALAVPLSVLTRPGLAAAPASCHPMLQGDNGQASQILSQLRPFAPRDRAFFYSYELPDWKDAPPLERTQGPGLNEEETRLALRLFLERRFPCSPDRVQDGMAVYGDPVARQKIPEPTLRAALAALTGTLGEPAIEFLLYRTPVTLVHFGVVLDPSTGLPGRVGAASVAPDGTRSIVIDRQNRFNPFGAFSGLLVHEALHTGADDDNAGLPEEATASAIEALVYMEMVLTDPTIAQLPDEFTRSVNNHQALVRLNSGLPGSDALTIFVPDSNVNIDPLAAEPVTEFYDYYDYFSAPDDPDFRERTTRGNWLLRSILEKLSNPGDSTDVLESANFDAATLEFIDQHQNVLTPAELIAVACILHLNVTCQ